jgi:GT2 family glycosyltransferase
MSPPRSIGIAILFFERATQTLECIESFLPAAVPVYVLDNGSSTGQARRLARAVKAWPRVTLLHVSTNRGVAAGRNLLVRRTVERWLFFADNDVRMQTAGWVELFHAHATAHPATEVFVPRLFNVHDGARHGLGRLSVRDGVLRWEHADAGRGTNCFPGGVAIVRRSLFERVGLYDEAMFVGFEDWELAVRALRRGAPVRARAAHDIELVHEHRAAAGAAERAAARVRYDTRRLARSHRRLTAKHGIRFPSDWRRWVARQRAIIGVR